MQQLVDRKTVFRKGNNVTIFRIDQTVSTYPLDSYIGMQFKIVDTKNTAVVNRPIKIENLQIRTTRYVTKDEIILTKNYKNIDNIKTKVIDEDGLAKEDAIKSITNFINGITVNSSAISCGVSALNNLQGSFSNIRKYIFTNKYLLEILNKEFKDRLKAHVLSKKKTKFSLISITDNQNHIDLTKLLDETTDFKTDYGKNPNSGNNIKIWIYKW